MNYQTIYDQLRRGGLTDAAALGMLGNWSIESGCEPFRIENDFSAFRTPSKDYTAAVTSGRISRQQFGSDRKGYGLAQWTYVNEARTAGRKFDLYDFWKRSGKALDDVTMQVSFCLHELTHGYAAVRPTLISCEDLSTCVDVICRRYEQPAQNNTGERYAAAQEIEKQIDKTAWNMPKEESSMTQNEAVQRLLTIARQEIGYHEKASNAQLDDKTANSGSANYTKYARDLDRLGNFYNGPKQGFAWCDDFVDWCFVAAFGPTTGREMIYQPLNSAGAGCLYSAQYYQSTGHFSKSDPQPGDQIFFTYSPGEISHTGIVEAVNGSTINTIEGNTSDSVARRTYQIGSSNIYGFGRPNWSLVAAVSDPDSGTEPGETPAQNPEPPPLPSCKVTLPELRQGDSGTPVERLQTLLIGRGYFCGGRQYSGRETPDGDFGPATDVAVRDLQLSAGITQDGAVGPDTWTALITT